MVRFKTALLVAAAGLGLAAAARGQETNAWPGWAMTRLESVQTNTERVIIKATSPVGVVVAGGGTLEVSCKEVTDAALSQKVYGIGITFNEGQPSRDTVLIDYEELEPLLAGLDYISKIDWSVTPLAGFDAFYTTKDGFRVVAFSRSRTGSIDMAVRALRYNQRLLLMPDQVAQLRNYIEQARNKLDEIRGAR